MTDINEIIAAGRAAQAEGRSVEAMALAREAVARAPHNPRALNLLGAACAEEMEFEEARRAFAAAVDADPTQAYSLVNFAYALILDGEFAEAEHVLGAALALESENPGAYLNLTWIRRTAAGDPLIGTLENLRQRAGPDQAACALYCFALGKCYDDVGEYDLAFKCFDEANCASVATFGIAYDAEAMERRFEAIKSVYSKSFVNERATAGFCSNKPVFILGFPRCGSTLLEQKLADHPSIAALGERPDIVRSIQLIGANHPAQKRYPDWAPELPIGALDRFGRHYVETFERRHPDAARFADKNLLNFPFAGFIRTILPKAHIIECRRNPIDTGLSCFMQRLDSSHQFKFSLKTIGHYYRRYSDVMTHWRETLGSIALVEYETFIADPDAESTRILSTIGLTPATERSAATRHIQTSSAFSARQPVYITAVARWKNYEKYLGPLIDALGDLAR